MMSNEQQKSNPVSFRAIHHSQIVTAYLADKRDIPMPPSEFIEMMSKLSPEIGERIEKEKIFSILLHPHLHGESFDQSPFPHSPGGAGTGSVDYRVPMFRVVLIYGNGEGVMIQLDPRWVDSQNGNYGWGNAGGHATMVQQRHFQPSPQYQPARDEPPLVSLLKTIRAALGMVKNHSGFGFFNEEKK